MSYLQQHKLVLMCAAWGADRKDAVLVWKYPKHTSK
jgi:hypothetical protein